MNEIARYLEIGVYKFVHSSDINSFEWKDEISIDLENSGVDYVFRVKANTFIGLQAKPNTYNAMTFQKRHNRSGNRLFSRLYKGKVFYFDGSLGKEKVTEILVPKIQKEIAHLKLV